MPDNSAALRQSRRTDSRTKRRRAAEVLDAMVEAGDPISFPAVARRAGVSVSLLYADTDLARRISAARDRQHQAGSQRAWRLPAHSLVTEASLRADLANAKEQARQLAEEVTLLKHRLARDLGTTADLAAGRQLSPLIDQLEERTTQVETENHQLRERASQLQAELHELTDTLEAARAMNRELMNEINRSDTASSETDHSRKQTGGSRQPRRVNDVFHTPKRP